MIGRNIAVTSFAELLHEPALPSMQQNPYVPVTAMTMAPAMT